MERKAARKSKAMVPTVDSHKIVTVARTKALKTSVREWIIHMVTLVVRSIAAIAIPKVIVHRAGSALLPRFALRPHGLLESRDAGFVARPERSLQLPASVATRPMALGPLVINIAPL